MMQGDTYDLGFTVKNNAGSIVTPADVLDVEITLGHISKTYRRGEVTFGDDRWYFPLSQTETFGFWPRAVKAQIRVRWKNGIVEGKVIHGVRINESISREVL
jgi:hypothetical protein